MRLRIINTVFYAGLSLMTAAVLGYPLRLALHAVLDRYSYEPDLALPWLWVGLGLTLAIVLASTASQLAQGRRAGLLRYALLLLVLAGSFAARRSVTPPARPTVEDGLSHLVARAELAADAVFSRTKRYPDAPAALTPEWPPDLLDLGFYQRGALPFRSALHVLPDVYGPALVAPPQTHPGDVVFALTPDHRHYWLTAFVLNAFGRVVPLTDASGRAIVASAVDGHPASRLDPLFPEYPNKLPVPGPRM